MQTTNVKNPINEFIENVAEGINVLAKFGALLENYLKRPEVAEKILSFIENIKKFPSYEKQLNALLAKNGWYTNWDSPFDLSKQLIDALEGNTSSLDVVMVKHLTEDWDKITSRILKNYPQREKILKSAFKLHIDENYIAAIPLFLSQCDGIVFKDFNHSLFDKKKIKDTLEKKMVNGNFERDGVLDIYYEALRVKNAFSVFSENADKQLGPNRNGIMHGLENHLDYGTRINSFKAFSLLAYLDSMFNEE